MVNRIVTERVVRTIVNVFRWVISRFSYILAAIILLAGEFGFSQLNTRSNLEIFDDQISAGLDRILYLPDLRRDVQFIFSVNSLKNDDSEVRFINSVIKKAAERNKLRVSLTKGTISSTDSVFNSVNIDIVKLKTFYPGFAENKFLGDKSVHRDIKAQLNITVQGYKYDFYAADTVAVNYRDRVDYNNIESIESAEYKFTHSRAPKESFYEEIIFPVAIVAVSVIAAVLFFSIRSK